MNQKQKIKARELADVCPDYTNAQIADQMGVSVRTIYRWLGSQQDRENKQLEIQEAELDTNPKDNPNILVLDIETSLCEAYVWGTGQQYVGPQQIEKPSSILCWAATWFGKKPIYSACVSPQESIERQDTSVMRRLWSLLDEADIICGHNVARFDLKKINVRFLLNGLPKPSPFQIWDTLTISRRHFGSGFESHKLDYLCQRLGHGEKLETGYDLWKDAAKGSQSALTRMAKYCKHDVKLTAELLSDLQPWIAGVNVATFMDTDEMVCPVCGCKELTEIKPRHTVMGKYRSYRCSKCGAIGSAKNTMLSKQKNKNLLRSV